MTKENLVDLLKKRDAYQIIVNIGGETQALHSTLVNRLEEINLQIQEASNEQKS